MIIDRNQHTQLVTDSLCISGLARSPDISLSNVIASSLALVAGLYDVWTTTDCYLMANSAVTGLTTTTGYLLRAGNTITIAIGANEKLSGITSAATGTLSFHQVR